MPQVKNETLGVDDTHPHTVGGPPIWMALAIVGGLFLAVAAIVFVVIWAM